MSTIIETQDAGLIEVGRDHEIAGNVGVGIRSGLGSWAGVTLTREEALRLHVGLAQALGLEAGHLVRIVSEETFRGADTSFVGPFPSEEAARVYVDDLEAHHGGEVECYVETLHAVPEGY